MEVMGAGAAGGALLVVCVLVLLARSLCSKRRAGRNHATPRFRMHGSKGPVYNDEGAVLRQGVGSGSSTPHQPKVPRASLPQAVGRAGRARISGYLSHEDDTGEADRRNPRGGRRNDGGKLMSTAI